MYSHSRHKKIMSFRSASWSISQYLQKYERLLKFSVKPPMLCDPRLSPAMAHRAGHLAKLLHSAQDPLNLSQQGQIDPLQSTCSLALNKEAQNASDQYLTCCGAKYLQVFFQYLCHPTNPEQHYQVGLWFLLAVVAPSLTLRTIETQCCFSLEHVVQNILCPTHSDHDKWTLAPHNWSYF